MTGNRTKIKSLKANAPSFTKTLADIDAIHGKSLSFHCRVDGYPKPEVHWEKNGKLLGKSRNIHMTRCGENCSLELRDVREIDVGLYQCVAENINGITTTECSIRIPGMSKNTLPESKPSRNLRAPESFSFRSRSTDRQIPKAPLNRSRSSSGKLRNEDKNSKLLEQKNKTEITTELLSREPRTKFKVPINPKQITKTKSPLCTQNPANKGSAEPLKTYLNKNLQNENWKFQFKSRNGHSEILDNCLSTKSKIPLKLGLKTISRVPIKETCENKFKNPSNKISSRSNKEENGNVKKRNIVSSHNIIKNNSVDLKQNHEIQSQRQVKDINRVQYIAQINKLENESIFALENIKNETVVNKNMINSDGNSVEELPEKALKNNSNNITEETDNCAHLFEDQNGGTEKIDKDALESESTIEEVENENDHSKEKGVPEITIQEINEEGENCIDILNFCHCSCGDIICYKCHNSERNNIVNSKMGLERQSSGIFEEALEAVHPEAQVACEKAEPFQEDKKTLKSANGVLKICVKNPTKILKGPVSATVKNGEKVTLSVTFMGSLPNRVIWLKGGTFLQDGGSYSIVTEDYVSEMTIHSVTADDSGKYISIVENDYGGDSCFASVAVLGFPKPPGGPPTASDFTDHSLVLSWYGSMYDGGSVLTGYIVEMCQIPGRHWQTATTCIDTSCVVDGLSLGQRYVFRVRARNRYGQSEPSRETHTICLDDYLQIKGETDEMDDLPNNNVDIQTFAEFMDRYDLKEEVGRGKFGKVYRCVDKWTGLPRAAKMIRCRKSKDKSDVRREIEVMKHLRHPKLVRIAGAFESDKMMVMVTEYISGGELFQRVIMDDFVLTESDCILFMRQICDGVNYMHKSSVLHLDLKPENILCKTRTSHQIKIIDFGLSTFYNPKESLCILFGTPEFVAPEVIAFEPVGPLSDMWSIGVICYVLLSGLSPFLGDSESETFANITRGTIDFEEEEFDNISEDAKNFISDIIIKNPRRRLTAQEALDHPWLKRAYWLEDYPPLSTEKLKKFIIRRKWQKSGTAIRALRRFVTLSRSSAESFGELESPSTPISPAATDTSEDSGIFHDSGCFEFVKDDT